MISYKLVSNKQIIPFGQQIGIDSKNIIAYSSDEKTNPNIKKYSYLKLTTPGNIKKIFCGIKFQCVEYARRWLILVKNITFEQIDMAYQLFTSDYICFKNIWTKQQIPYTKCPNGSTISPVTGSILLWDKADNYLTGHVAIILNIDENYVYIGEQNWEDILWSNSYARKIPIIRKLDQIWLNDSNEYNLNILGWLNLNF